MAQTLPETLTELLTPVIDSAGLFLEGIETTKAGRYSTVRVTVDLPDGEGDIDLDTIASVTQAISEALDTADPIKGQYTLEVTSPGAQRELTTPRHFRRAQGHTVEVETTPGSGSQHLVGTLVDITEDSITVAASEGSSAGVTQVLLADIATARTVVIF